MGGSGKAPLGFADPRHALLPPLPWPLAAMARAVAASGSAGQTAAALAKAAAGGKTRREVRLRSAWTLRRSVSSSALQMCDKNGKNKNEK
jgi:hypothetical protein